MTLSPGVGTWPGALDDHESDTDASVVEKSWETPDMFAVLFDRHAGDIHRYVARRLGVDAADDLMAETFVVAFQQRRRYDLAQPQARPWLYGIATNLVRRHRRVEARRLRALSRAASLAAGGENTEGEPMEDRVAEKVSAERASRVLAGALARLPARHRDVLLLVAWGGLDYAETARSLGIPVGTVRSRLHRARAQLRGSIGTQDAHPAAVPHKEHDHG
ncbi:RNA polymerase sigma factor [Streptomyces sp. NPDC059582]|uniref:RNA polymerase sigma factor n=1 Tax=Streptomyces sp. NPDC059582 TaxID=3346875 RepID=UPI0036B67B9F